jgi:hypothetical protein
MKELYLDKLAAAGGEGTDVMRRIKRRAERIRSARTWCYYFALLVDPSNTNSEPQSNEVRATAHTSGSTSSHPLGRIYQLDPILAEAIQGGFEDAVDKIRKTATKSRTRVTSHIRNGSYEVRSSRFPSFFEGAWQ